MKLLYPIFLLLLVSCDASQTQQKDTSNNLNTDSLVKDTVKPKPITLQNDTTIKYDIEGISSEGTEATVKYMNGKINEAVIKVYGETGQAEIVYSFLNNGIVVKEKELGYSGSLEKVNSEKDMKIKKELTYKMNYNGVPIGKADPQRLDIFKEFKNVVPFELK